MKTKLLLLLSLFVIGFSYAQIPTTGLHGYYEFTNGSLNDATVNANNFTKNGTATVNTNDRYSNSDSAISLNGDYLTRGNVAYPSSGGDIELGAISFWIKTTTNDSDIRTILDDTNGRSNTADTTWGGYYFYLRDGQVGISSRVQYSTGTYEGAGVLGADVVSDGGWHHVVANIRCNLYFTGASDIASTYVTLYVDGVSQGTGSASELRSFYAGGLYFSQTIDTNGNITIGNNRTNSLPAENIYNDEIDDLIFYTRNLSTTEVEQIALYNSFCFPDETVMTLSNITKNTLDVSLPTTATYDLAYHVKNEPFSNATIITDITSGSEVITGLISSTQYSIYVRQHCTSSVKSAWSSAVNFRSSGPIFVKHDATGDNTGSSWLNAFTDLQSALAIDQDGDEIWISSGTYKPGSDRLHTFSFNKDNTKIYGGFIGTESSINQRDIITNKTILSGDVNNDDTGVDFSGVNRTDNNYHVAEIYAFTTLIDGVNFENGHANDTSGSTESYGAGLNISTTSTNITLKNCEFNNNVSFNGGAVRAYFDVNTTFNIEECKFNNNLSKYGSGLYVLVNQSHTVNVNISNSLFTNNVSKDYSTSAMGYTGSGVWLRANGFYSNLTSKITNCTFANNQDIGNQSGSERGALALGRHSSSTHNVEVNNTIIWGNTGVLFNTASINFGHTTAPNLTSVTNSIGEDNFTNITNPISSSNSDPLFTDASNNDFTLQATSPGIDSGSNTFVSSIDADIIGNSRVFNTTVDLGVYEYGSSVPVDRILTLVATNGTVTLDVQPTNGIYTDGTLVQLTATPDVGYQFDGWSGDATGITNPLSITMDADKSVTAMFSLLQQTLTTSATNGAIAANISSTNGTYDNGTLVELTATPAVGYQFDGWSGDVTGITNPLSITMDADKTITAMFSPIQQTLTITATNGTVTADVQPTSGTYDYGEAVELTATPDTGYQFDGWSGDATGSTNPLNITMDADKSVTALFSVIQYTVTYTAVNGTISADVQPVNGTYDIGTLLELTATPDAGYQFDGWGGDLTGLVSNTASTSINSDRSFIAFFSPIQQTLTTPARNGTIVADIQPTSGTYDNGTVVELTATPATGYQFDGWSGDASGTTNPLNIIMDGDKSVTAMFSVDTTASIVNDVFNNSISTYPNPVTNSLTISLATGQTIQKVEVFNLLGKKVISTSNTTVDFSTVSKGIYLLKIVNTNGEIATRKVVKK